MNHLKSHSLLIKEQAKGLGFSFCGISKARFLEEEAIRLENWLHRGFQGKMSYLENHFDKRLDPTQLVPGAKSVVSLLMNYFPYKDLGQQKGYKVAKYAYGQDYHFALKHKLKSLLQWIWENIGEVNGRCFVDSAPVMERTWAAQSGLGWIGKNTLLLNRSQGSFFFLAELIIDLELETDAPINDYCGTCTRCIDACPTNALTSYEMDAQKCISYLTIELKDQIPAEFSDQMGDWIFGCDICQDVCPWNRFSKPHQEEAFDPPQELEQWDKKDWEELTEEVFKKVFKKSPLKRTKFTGLKRNIAFVKKKSSGC